MKKTKKKPPTFAVCGKLQMFVFLYIFKRRHGIQTQKRCFYSCISPLPSYFQPCDDAQSVATPLWYDPLLSGKSTTLQTGSVMHPEFCADKNCTGRDGIIYVLVNLLGRLTALTLCTGIDGMSNFLLQTPISFSVTLRQTSRSSQTSRCGSFIFQYVCD